MFDGPRRGGRSGAVIHCNPQHSHARHGFPGTLRYRRRFSRRPQPGGCHGPVNGPSTARASETSAGRHRLCGGRPWRRPGQPSRIFALRHHAERRESENPDGTRRHVDSGQARAVFWMPPPARFPNQTIIGGNKKICSRDRNKAPKATLSVKRRAKPPSPSPSITRRRTPAVFAVGVLLFNHVRSRRARPAEPTNRRRIECSQVSCASVWCLARGRARRSPRGQVRSAFLFVQ
jgi:hypothetical protein